MLDVIYAGQSVRRLGAIVNTITPMPRAKRRVTTYEVPGRHGLLHMEDQGFDPVTRDLSLSARTQHAKDAVDEWCVTSGEMTVTSEPGFYYRAYQHAEVSWAEKSPTLFTTTISFEVIPCRYIETGRKPIEITETGSIFNAESIESEPLILLTATGDVTLYVGNYVLNMKNLSGMTSIDSEMQMMIRDGKSVENAMRGDCPLLVPGHNIITWIGNVESVTMIPRWRRL